MFFYACAWEKCTLEFMEFPNWQVIAYIPEMKRVIAYMYIDGSDRTLADTCTHSIDFSDRHRKTSKYVTANSCNVPKLPMGC